MKLVDLPEEPAPAPAITEPEQQAEPAVEGEGGESE